MRLGRPLVACHPGQRHLRQNVPRPSGVAACSWRSPAPASLGGLRDRVFSESSELEKIVAEEHPNKCVQCPTAATSAVSVRHDRLNECFVTVTSFSLGWTAPTAGLATMDSSCPDPPPGHSSSPWPVVNPLHRPGCPL